MTRLFYDTEFIEDGHTIDLISIGIVTDDGREYYAVNNDRRVIQEAVEHEWLSENVVPSLPLKRYDHAGGMSVATDRYGRMIEFAARWDWDRTHPDFAHVKPRHQIATDLVRIVRATTDPQLWAWYGAYDHVVLCQLFGPMVKLPKGMPMFTNDLKQECVRLGDPRVPEQEAGAHNALADARHNKVIADFLDALTNADRDAS